MKINFSLGLNKYVKENEPIFDYSEIRKCIKEFLNIYKKRPFNNSGGIKLNSAFAYYFFLKKINPNFVVESGIWRGFSTWLIEQILQKPEIICLDPVLMMPIDLGTVYRSKRAQYATRHWFLKG